jgi:hypothetical protein
LGEHRQDRREARNDQGQSHPGAQTNPAQRVNWQAPARQQAGNTATGSQAGATHQNNGNHTGWTQGRGNSGRRG